MSKTKRTIKIAASRDLNEYDHENVKEAAEEVRLHEGRLLSVAFNGRIVEVTFEVCSYNKNDMYSLNSFEGDLWNELVQRRIG